jgi:hypothetical protein
LRQNEAGEKDRRGDVCPSLWVAASPVGTGKRRAQAERPGPGYLEATITLRDVDALCPAP